MNPPRSRSTYYIALCVGIFILLSVLLYLQVPDAQSRFDPDSYGYDAIALQFAHKNILTDQYNPADAPIQPVGYPFFLGVLYKLFGHDYACVVVAQLALMLGCMGLLYALCAYLFVPPIALIVLFLSSINLGFLIYPQFLLAEVLCLFFILAFFLLFFYYQESKKITYLICSGLVLGLSVLVKPFALLFGLLCTVIIAVWFPGGCIKKIKIAALFLLSFYLPIGAYMVRNYILYNRFALAPMNELNIYQCFLSKVIAKVDNIPVQDVVADQLAFTGTHSFDSDGWADAKQLFWQYLKSHPFVFVQVWCINVAKTFFGLFSTQLKRLVDPQHTLAIHSFFNGHVSMCQRMANYIFLGTDLAWVKVVALLEACWNVVRLPLALLGLYVLYVQRAYFIFWLLSFFIFQSAFITGMDGCCRYRVMFEPLLIILTALGIYSTYKSLKGKPRTALSKRGCTQKKA